MIDKKRSIKKILIFTWLLIAIPVFVLTIYFDRDSSYGLKKKDKSFKNEISQSVQDTSINNQDLEEELSTTEPTSKSTNQSVQIIDIETDISNKSPQEGVESSNIDYSQSFLTPMPLLSPIIIARPTISISTLTPTPIPIEKIAYINILGLGNYEVDLKENDTAFSILQRASRKNDFTINYQNYNSLGAFIKCIAGVCNNNQYYWTFYYNDQYSTIGSSFQLINNNDITGWKFEKH